MKKNKKLMLIVASLLVVIGVSFSYFLALTLINGKGSSVVGTTARIKGAEINVEGTLEFNDTDVYPGHKNVSAIKVTATGNNQLIPYHLIWKGESGISQINFIVYKSSAPKTLSTNCERKTGVQNGMQVLSEECTISNLDTLGEAIASGSISKGDTKEILVQDEFITATSSGTSMYYYVVLEYPNLDEDQSSDANATFQGEVTVEESNKEADINILAVYVEDDSGNYTETTDIPQSGYALNSEKSTCSNGTTPGWDIDNSRFYADNLTKSGTSCYLYFDIDNTPLSYKLAVNLVGGSYINDARSGAITIDTEKDDAMLYSVEDDYGISYVYSGINPNNWVYFAGFYWRIIRINGDGTIRLIYNGTEKNSVGAQTQLSNKRAYNKYYSRDNAYVGFMYGSVGSNKYSDTHSNTNPSEILGAFDGSEEGTLNWWYKNNILNNENAVSKIDVNSTFCNDRKVVSEVWNGYIGDGSNQTQTSYAPVSRLYENTRWADVQHPSLKCSQENDIFSVSNATRGNKALIYPVGLITSDEAVLAGGFGGTQTEFWLNTNQDYWTMSPSNYSSGGYAYVFYISNDGIVFSFANDNSVGKDLGVRPVINLKANLTFKQGTDGSIERPYELVD